jgi:hypothetical protein
MIEEKFDTTGVRPCILPDFVVYPNPTRDYLLIRHFDKPFDCFALRAALINRDSTLRQA